MTLRQSGGTSVAVGRSLIWVAQNNCVCPSLLGVSPTDLRIAARPPILTGGPIATQGTALWLQTSQYPPVITELHPGNPRRITIPRDAAGCCLALTNGAAWYGAGLRVWKIAASVPLVNTDTIHLPANVDGFATGAGKLWVATDTAVVAIDPQTDTKSASVHLALPPSGIAYYLGKLWLTIV